MGLPQRDWKVAGSFIKELREKPGDEMLCVGMTHINVFRGCWNKFSMTTWKKSAILSQILKIDGMKYGKERSLCLRTPMPLNDSR